MSYIPFSHFHTKVPWQFRSITAPIAKVKGLIAKVKYLIISNQDQGFNNSGQVPNNQ